MASLEEALTQQRTREGGGKGQGQASGRSSSRNIRRRRGSGTMIIAVPILFYRLCLLDLISAAEETPLLNTEFCQWETAKLDCDVDSVIMTVNATYGRMGLNRCVLKDYGYLWCGLDVTASVDHRCSGRRSCHWPVSLLHGHHNCPIDLAAYLTVTYTCTSVVRCSEASCRQSGHARIESASGVISSQLTSDEGCGSFKCPWVIDAAPGQMINFTLVDFSYLSNRQVTAPNWKTLCYWYLVISDKYSVNKEVTSCVSGWKRERNVHIITDSTATVAIHRQSAADDVAFLLAFEVIGCSDVNLPPFSSYRRERNVLIVTCDHSTSTWWRLQCNGSHWQGDMGQCPGYSRSPEPGGVESNTTHFGVLLVIGLGITLGAVFGLLLLIALMAFSARRRAPQTVIVPESWLGVVEGGSEGQGQQQQGRAGGIGDGAPSRPQTLLRGCSMGPGQLILYAAHDRCAEYGSVLELKPRYASSANILENLGNTDDGSFPDVTKYLSLQPDRPPPSPICHTPRPP